VRRLVVVGPLAGQLSLRIWQAQAQNS